MRGQSIEKTQVIDQRAMQCLIMSPKMQQALHLLQLPIGELSTFLESEIEQNPLLELTSNSNSCTSSFSRREEEAPIIENRSSIPSLFEHLMLQARTHFSKASDLLIAENIFGHLDENGFFTTSIEELALFCSATPSQVESVLSDITQFDPPGIGAKNLQESLLIQLKQAGKEESVIHTLIKDHFGDLVRKDFGKIEKKLKLPHLKDLLEKELLKLHFGKIWPRSHYKEHYNEWTPYIIPDLCISVVDEKLIIEVANSELPSFRFNQKYLALLAEESDPHSEARAYIQEKIAAAHWLFRNLTEREHTLRRIAEVLVKKQRQFFLAPEGKLLPFQMKEVALALSLHESTVARACANKYVSTPRGIFALRSFFTHGFINETGESISAKTVEEEISAIIKNENPKKPLSDEAIVSLLTHKKLKIARRTVAKYRYKLGIDSRAARRKNCT